jgi:hypothetical protein
MTSRPRALLLLLAAGAAALVAFLALRPKDAPGVQPPGAERSGRSDAGDEPRHARAPGDGGSPVATDGARTSADGADRPATTAPGQVRGVVVAADEGDEAPVAGATVRAHPVDPHALARGLAVADGEAIATTTTARDGTFALDAPGEGWLRIVASAPGRATGAALAPGAGAHVVLRLGTAASLVVETDDEEGKPVAGASVEVAARDVLHLATTDAQGRARFDALAVGHASVRAWAPGTAEARVPGVVAEPGAAGEVLVVLRPATRVEGRVVDAESGMPVPGA